jgi:L-amino acid N-acyltransferase YncA
MPAPPHKARERGSPPDKAPAATAFSKYRPRRVRLDDGREVSLRAIAETDAPEIVQAFERLSPESRYTRFMHHKKEVNAAALQRGVNPVAGTEGVLVATVPAADGIDIVGAAQYVQAGITPGTTCEFAVTIAEDWRRSGLAKTLLRSLIRRARRDGYETMEGWVIAGNKSMLELARQLRFTVERIPDDPTMVRVVRALQPAHPRRGPTPSGA